MRKFIRKDILHSEEIINLQEQAISNLHKKRLSYSRKVWWRWDRWQRPARHWSTVVPSASWSQPKQSLICTRCNDIIWEVQNPDGVARTHSCKIVIREHWKQSKICGLWPWP